MLFSVSFQRNQNLYIFPSSISLSTIDFSLCHSLIFQLIASGVTTDAFNMVTSVGLVSYILADLGPRGELLTKQTSLQPYARLPRIALRNFASLFSPATISLASLHETHVSLRHKAIFKRNASVPTQDELNRDKMADTIAARAHGVSNSRL